MEKLIRYRERKAKIANVYFCAAGLFLLYETCRVIYDLAAAGSLFTDSLFRSALILPASIILGIAVCVQRQSTKETLKTIGVFLGTLSDQEKKQIERYVDHVEEVFGKTSMRSLACILTDEWIYQWNVYDLTFIERIYRKEIKEVYIKRQKIAVPLVYIRTGIKGEKLVGTYWRIRHTCEYGGLVKVNDELFQMLKKSLPAEKQQMR